MDGRRCLIAERRRRRRERTATRKCADAVERLAQASVRFGDQERHAEHARPRLPFGHDVGAVAGAKERKRQSMVAVLEHDRDRAGRPAFGRLHPQRDAEIGRDRKVDRHLDAAHGAPNHDPLPGQFDVPHAFVGRLVGDREPHR